jgi:hypothetical protein
MNRHTLEGLLKYCDIVAELKAEESKAEPCSGLVAVLKLQREWTRAKLLEGHSGDVPKKIA